MVRSDEEKPESADSKGRKNFKEAVKGEKCKSQKNEIGLPVKIPKLSGKKQAGPVEQTIVSIPFQDFNESITKQLRLHEGLLVEAKEQLSKKKYENCIDLLEKFVELAPASSLVVENKTSAHQILEACNILGKSYREQGKTEEAISAYNKCLNMGRIYGMRLGNHLKYRLDASVALTSLHKSNGDINDACTSLKTATKIVKELLKYFENKSVIGLKLCDCIELHEKLSSELIKQGKLFEAYQLLRKAIQLKIEKLDDSRESATSAMSFEKLGQVLLKLKMYNDAYRSFQHSANYFSLYTKMEKESIPNFRSFFGMGNAKYEMKEYEEALKNFNNAKIIMENLNSAKFNIPDDCILEEYQLYRQLTNCNIKLNQLEDALKDAKTAMKVISPKGFKFWDTFDFAMTLVDNLNLQGEICAQLVVNGERPKNTEDEKEISVKGFHEFASETLEDAKIFFKTALSMMKQLETKNHKPEKIMLFEKQKQRAEANIEKINSLTRKQNS